MGGIAVKGLTIGNSEPFPNTCPDFADVQCAFYTVENVVGNVLQEAAFHRGKRALKRRQHSRAW